VPYSPGGGSDIVGRALAQSLSEILGQSVVVDNKPGGSAVIGSDIVAKARPDGYTLLLADSPHAINGAVLPKLPFRPVQDFAAVGLIGRTPLVLVVNPKLPANTFADYRRLARDGRRLNIASGGNGTLTHLVGELMKEQADLPLVHVPFKGTGQAIGDVVAGHVESMISTMPGVVSHVKAGTLRALAVTGRERSPLMPDVPTFGEAGLSGFVESTWYGVLAPAGLPADVQGRLNGAMATALARADLRQKLQGVAVEPAPGPASELAKIIEDDVRKWTAIVSKHGIKAD
jgi:tripartite-type tricarboxylate transporter receptor subunit TctC